MNMASRRIILGLALALALIGPARAWDSRLESGFMVGVPLHAQFAVLAIQALQGQYGDLRNASNQEALIRGSLTELHELSTKELDKADGRKYGLNDLDALRILHKGTNEGCDDIAGWWQDAVKAYRLSQNTTDPGTKAAQQAQAYFLVGIMLHMVADMGVPAHANLVYHQGNLSEKDNFEVNAAAFGSYITSNVPSTKDLASLVNTLKGTVDNSRINLAFPITDDPSTYYNFSRRWTQSDAPGYKKRDGYPLIRFLWTLQEENLMKNRQSRTAKTVEYALLNVERAFSTTLSWAPSARPDLAVTPLLSFLWRMPPWSCN